MSGQGQGQVTSGQGARMDGFQMDDYPTDSYAISPTAFLLQVQGTFRGSFFLLYQVNT